MSLCHHRLLLLSALAGASLLPAVAIAGRAPASVAVLSLAAKGGFDTAQVSILDDLLLAVLQKTVSAEMRVVGQSDVDRLLGFEKAKDLLGCNDVTCAAEVAGALGVDSLIYGSVGQLGKAQVLSLSWIDRETGQVLGRASETVSGAPEELIEALNRAVPKLLGKAPVVTTTPPAPVATAKPAAAPTKVVLAPPSPRKPPSRLPAESSAPGNLALNTTGRGSPDPLESDSGWGGGAQPWDLVDGRRTYPGEWARGLAFTGGGSRYQGSCGWRQATVNLGAPKRFGRVVLWFHGDNQAADRCRLEYWNGSAWIMIADSTECRLYMPYLTSQAKEWWQSWSTPMKFDFTPVEGSKVRFSFDNCDCEHGWLYELEVFEHEP